MRRLAFSAYLFITSFLFAVPSLAQEGPRQTPQFRSFSSRKTLVVLPFSNETGRSRLDYLGSAASKMIADKIQELSYIPAGRVQEDFRANPGNAPLGDLPAASRSLLEVQTPDLNAQNRDIFALTDRNLQARKLRGDIVVTGRLGITYPGASPALEHQVFLIIEMFDMSTQDVRKFVYILDDRTILRNLEKPGEDLKIALSGQEKAILSVETAQTGSLVYLDDQYLGRTPVESAVLPGRYLLRVEGEGFRSYSTEVNLVSGRRIELRPELIALNHSASIRVASVPDNALVYLDSTFLGRTPLEKSALPAGDHRLRISLEGHIDRIRGVHLENGKTEEVSLELTPGDNAKHFSDPGFAILDWTYGDLSFYSMVSVLGFYGGWMIFSVEKQRTINSLRPMDPFILGAYDTSNSSAITAAQTNPFLFYYYNQLEENNRLHALKWARLSKASASAGVFSFLMSAFFLYKYLYDGRETGEISRGFLGTGRLHLDVSTNYVQGNLTENQTRAFVEFQF